MCGISFVLTSEAYCGKAEAFMKESLIVNQVRGMHSTGIFQIATNGDISYFKQAVNASQFIGVTEAKNLLGKAARSRLTVGHVRHATQGAADKSENAHPFMVTREDGSKLIGVHNGNFRSFKNKKNSKDFEVDSAWAFQMLADEKADAFEYFDGAFALVWYDTLTPDVLYMARNKDRPLHYMISEDGKSMYGMSELGSLGWLTGASRVDIKKTKEEQGFFFLEPGWIYQFDLKQIGKWDRAKYPEYDPKTTVHQPVSHVSHMYDDADWGGEHGFYQAPFRGERLHPGWRAPSSVDYDFEQTDRTLAKVKLALKQARNKRDAALEEGGEETSPIIDADALNRALEDGIAENIRKFQDSKKASLVPLSELSSPMYLASIRDQNATRGEIKSCQALQLYGMVVDFTPILYDEENASVLGDAEIYIHGKWVKIECSLRGITPRRGNFIYHPKRGPHRVTLCGYGTQPDPLPAYVVASEMHDSGKALIMNRVERLTSH